MPTYTYACAKCHKRFTRVEAVSTHSGRPPTCPKCGSRQVTQVFGSFFAKTSKKS